MLHMLTRAFGHRLPRRCFISHSYKDAELGYIDRLRRQLPRHVAPYIFPPINVSPEQRVSDDLVKAVLSCQGLIHVDGANSSDSMWVSFERDLAIRMGMPVFSFSVEAERIARDTGKPMELTVYDSYSKSDHDRVHEITKFMADERSFSIFDPRSEVHQDISQFKMKLTTGSMLNILAGGGFVVSFISRRAIESIIWCDEQEKALTRYPNRVLPALLEPIEGQQLPRLLQEHSFVQLYQSSEPSRLDWNRVDDLLVRIYHMVHKEQKMQAANN